MIFILTMLTIVIVTLPFFTIKQESLFPYSFGSFKQLLKDNHYDIITMTAIVLQSFAKILNIYKSIMKNFNINFPYQFRLRL